MLWSYQPVAHRISNQNNRSISEEVVLMLKIIVIVIVVLIAALLVFAATKPGTFSVVRTASIKATPEKIFPLINDFHKWSFWSPWEKLDPAMKRIYSGPDSGKGSAYSWDGNNKVGKGSMEITGTAPQSKVTIKLDFEKPMAGHNVTDFTLEGKDDSTIVTWNMHGPSPYLTKVIGIFFNMDKMIGRDFEIGLANLKAIAEK